MKKRCFALFLALLCTASLFAAGTKETAQQTPTGPVDIKISTWTSNKDQLALLGTFVKEFADKKGVQVNPQFETIPFAEYTTKLSLELQGTEAPDVFWILETAAPAFIESNLLAPLDSQLAAYDFNDFSKGALALWQKKGVTYAVPFSTSPFFMLYNADLFKKAGVKTPEEMVADGTWTWENFRKAAKTITDKTGVYAFQTVDGGGYDARILHNLLPIIRSYGGDAWTDDGKVLINSKESVEAIKLFHDMVYVDGSVVPPGKQDDFFAGNAAMTVGQVSRVSKLKDSTFAWGMAPMPAGPKGNVPILGQAAIGANKKGKNSALASELVAYMTSQSCVARMAGIWPPARKSVLASKEFLSSNPLVSPERMKASVASSIETGRVLPSHVQYPQIEVESKMVWDKLWNKNADVQAVADGVAAVYSKYIK
jgi:multiple sugar transport system substrate-binding protein